MVWRQLIWFDACQSDEFWFRFACKVPNFQPTGVRENWNGLTPMGQCAKLSANRSPKVGLAWGQELAPMGHKEPAPHCNITYQTHMEDIQWSGGN
jgi:hypothetical protein